ncbi:unnamed protein product [Danaus chrysippus]|uniref:(African queen) hypothetical protein n=1 Tax=Danaus chrysippus TaxID=151541 RepID=A0A8J2WBD1_9NEOP|nr:unnamed protein product [Danaus chrysippus]
MDSGQYSRRHDRVLEIIRFVREGTRAIKSNVKPYSILKAASDWTIMMDTYEKQYKIPEDICASASRPDIFLYSRILARCDDRAYGALGNQHPQRPCHQGQ